MPRLSHGRRIGSEFLGSAFLLATVIGSGITGAKPSGGNEGLALLGNTLPTGAMLVVLITMLSPISGAHLNPAVTGVFWLKGEIKSGLALGYIFAQLAGGIAGVLAAHLMFDLPLLQLSTKIRSGPAQWFAEYVATFGLVLTILATLKAKPAAVPMSVGLYIIAAYWFTASTSFCQSRSHAGKGVLRYLCGHTSCRRCSIRYRAIWRCVLRTGIMPVAAVSFGDRGRLPGFSEVGCGVMR